jgi:hypothetical protein
MVEQALLAAEADVFLPKETIGQQLLPVVAGVLAQRPPSGPKTESAAIPE